MTSPRRQLRWSIPRNASPSSFLPLDRKLTGIYTLNFSNEEKYVGQTVNLINRLGDHLRRWDDIVGIDFIECSPDELNTLEETMIKKVDADFTLRNRTLIGRPGGSVPIDLVVDVQKQQEWFEGVQASYPQDERTLTARRRVRTQPKFDELVRQPEYEIAITSLRAYIEQVIPWPSATGGLFWAVSAMPRTGRSKSSRRLFTVSSHLVETLVLFAAQEYEPMVMMNVAKNYITSEDRKYFEIEDTTRYRSYPMCSHVFIQADQLDQALISSPSLRKAAREMALGLMRRGPSTFARFHCDALLDQVLVSMTDAP
jgi:hypothetical protein